MLVDCKLADWLLVAMVGADYDTSIFIYLFDAFAAN